MKRSSVVASAPPPAAGMTGAHGESDPSPDAGARDLMVARFIESLPVMRKVFEVRLDREQRAAWRPLTIHQLEALVVLDRSSVTMRELCDELDITESAGTALSDRLVAQGFVERCADPKDRRIIRLTMSQKARKMAEEYRAVKHRHIAEVLSVLDADELAALVHLCEQLVLRAGAATDTHQGLEDPL